MDYIMKNKKGLLIGGLLALAGVIGGGILMNKKSKEQAETEVITEDVENNESNIEE